MKDGDSSCIHCGDPLQYNRTGRTLASTGKPQKEGWGHVGGMRRDHDAFPSDVRSPQEDLDRQNVGRALAGVEVSALLGRQFMAHAVNEAMGGQ